MSPMTVFAPRQALGRLASLALVLAHGGQAYGLGTPADAAAVAAYRCAVLGEAQTCRPLSPAADVAFEDRLEPGPAALYLMHLGADKSVALELARAQGELPVRRVVRVTRNHASGEALYRRASGTGAGPADTVEAIQP